LGHENQRHESPHECPDDRPTFRLNQTVDATTLRKKFSVVIKAGFAAPAMAAVTGFIELILQHDCVKHPDFRDVRHGEYTHAYPALASLIQAARRHIRSAQDLQTVDRHFDWMQDAH
jgi:hypothetical protein